MIRAVSGQRWRQLEAPIEKEVLPEIPTHLILHSGKTETNAVRRKPEKALVIRYGTIMLFALHTQDVCACEV